jgi:hypothetical protein
VLLLPLPLALRNLLGANSVKAVAPGEPFAYSAERTFSFMSRVASDIAACASSRAADVSGADAGEDEEEYGSEAPRGRGGRAVRGLGLTELEALDEPYPPGEMLGSAEEGRGSDKLL